MGNIILTMQISLDGVVSDVERWMTLSDEILNDTRNYYETLGMVVVGGNTFASLAEYWQTAETSSESAIERDFARRINEIPKVVVSRKKRELVWNNSRQILCKDMASFVREMNDLKKMADGHISVESGVGIWRLFIETSLFDELWLLVHPVVAGGGDRLFPGNTAQLPMRLDSCKVYGNGVVGLRYRKQ